MDCGSDEELEFDHNDRNTKTFNMAKILASGSNRMVQEELEKCMLRCKSCHATKSLAQGDYIPGKPL